MTRGKVRNRVERLFCQDFLTGRFKTLYLSLRNVSVGDQVRNALYSAIGRLGRSAGLWTVESQCFGGGRDGSTEWIETCVIV